ncbi:hypothetical protein TWF970_003846 [Orbilia oligospora]|uniref:Protein kinase domain-containing protein n=1 Tax=Orbilia oligospora TaxID=2813651 RepID=A0A7C8VHQ0_ORBOL|nr:hypothetical protein TWF970_003846 [Orbilia oligospora]
MHPPYPGPSSHPAPCVCQHVDLEKAVRTRTVPKFDALYQPQYSDILLSTANHHWLTGDREIVNLGGGRIQGVIASMYTGIREPALARIAGDCAVPLLGHVYTPQCQIEGGPRLIGLIMEPAEKINFKDYVTLEAKEGLKNEMINLLERLHGEYGIIHGDVTPCSFMRWKGELRFVKFRASRLFNEGPENFRGERNVSYLCPNKLCEEGRPGIDFNFPTDPIEDWYALALVVYEIYTGCGPPKLDYNNYDGIHVSPRERKLPDLKLIEDETIRNWMVDIFRKGGCLINTATA